MTCNERNLARSFRRRHANILRPLTRGFGYWIWKPQIVLQRLQELEEEDLLTYCDVGCRFTQRGAERLEDYFAATMRSTTGIIGFKYFPPEPPFPHDGRELFNWRNRHWIKGDLLDHFGLRDHAAFVDDYCFAGGVLFLRNCNACRGIIEEWVSTMESDQSLIDDSPSKAPNHPHFIKHRHDQAVFNCLAFKHRIPAICGYEIQYPGLRTEENDWDTIANYPIHARRNKQLSRTGRLLTRLHRAWVKLKSTG